MSIDPKTLLALIADAPDGVTAVAHIQAAMAGAAKTERGLCIAECERVADMASTAAEELGAQKCVALLKRGGRS